jgi:hypothetical protein
MRGSMESRSIRLPLENGKRKTKKRRENEEEKTKRRKQIETGKAGREPAFPGGG